MCAYNDAVEVEYSKKREYLKQQHQLRTMTKTKPAITADDMIENLLSKKEIFQKKKEPNSSNCSQLQPVLPSWLTPMHEPQLYRQVWMIVRTSSGFADTSKLSNLLLTSRLSTEMLGYIWSLANFSLSPALSQCETYVTLALVALAQKGFTFTSIKVLCTLKDPPLPNLNIVDEKPHQLPSVMTLMQELNLSDLEPTPNLSLIDCSPSKSFNTTVNIEDEFSLVDDSFGDFQCVLPSLVNNVPSEQAIEEDEFDDFKSADLSSLSVLEVKEKPKDVKNMIGLRTPETDKSHVEDLFPKCVVRAKEEGSSDLLADVPVIEDKYSALRLLELDSENKASDQDDFGEFLTADPPIQSSPVLGNVLTESSHCNIQERCMEACIDLLEEAFKIFDSIDDEEVRSEVISDPKGIKYIEELIEVERIALRIKPSIQDKELIEKLENSLDALCCYLEPHRHSYMDEENGPKCGICLCERGPAYVKYGINNFHAPCANLYLHKVDHILPIAPVM